MRLRAQVRRLQRKQAEMRTQLLLLQQELANNKEDLKELRRLLFQPMVEPTVQPMSSPLQQTQPGRKRARPLSPEAGATLVQPLVPPNSRNSVDRNDLQAVPESALGRLNNFCLHLNPSQQSTAAAAAANPHLPFILI